jgi:hypothetical protein
MNGREGCRYRIVLSCDGVPVDMGAQAAAEIMKEFIHRPWHENVDCKWSGVSLLLTAENDFEAQGLALVDEFSDAIAACIPGGFNGDIRLVSITKF